MIKIQYDGKSKFIQRLCKVVNSKAELGETENSAYRGDRGKIAYEHSQAEHARTDATNVETSTTNGNIKIDGVEANVYTHPKSHSIDEISGLQEILDVNDNNVSEINSNLSRYNLASLNRNLVQGYIGNSGSSNPGGEIVNEKYVYDNIYHECNAGDLITLRTNLYRWHGIAFYDSNKTFLNMSEDGRSKQEWKAKAPTNSKYYRYYLGGDNITPQTCGNVYIYTNNSIDVLKNDLDDIVSNVDYTIRDYASFKGDILLSGNRIKIKGEIIPSIDCGLWWGIMSIPFSAVLDRRLNANPFYIDNDGTSIYCNAKLTANTSYNIDMEFQVNVSPDNRYLALKNSVLYETKTDLDKLNSLPKGTIVQIEADKDTIATTKEKYGWQYLGTSSIEYDNGSYVSMATNVYRKNN